MIKIKKLLVCYSVVLCPVETLRNTLQTCGEVGKLKPNYIFVDDLSDDEDGWNEDDLNETTSQYCSKNYCDYDDDAIIF